ncbi:MAG: hypothetical protein CME06_05560, partial [Gemmatimonadetes bacterium]|nr:hypothetical protein [Gemmatimonadota bacterium]
VSSGFVQDGARAEARRSSGKEGVAFGDAEPVGGPGYEWRLPANQCSVLPKLPRVEPLGSAQE